MQESTDIKNPVDENPFVFIYTLLTELNEMVTPYGGNIYIAHVDMGLKIVGEIYRKNEGYTFVHVVPRGDFYARMGYSFLRERLIEIVSERVTHAIRELDAQEDAD